MKKISVLVFIFSFVMFFNGCAPDNEITPSGNDSNSSLHNELPDGTMNLSPYKIILNSKGNDQTIQIIFGGSMPSGYSIQSYDIQLYFNDVEVADAISFRYCYIDHNYLGEFDRTGIINNTYVKSLAGTTPLCTASGSYVLTNGSEEITVEFSKYAYAVIEKPGK